MGGDHLWDAIGALGQVLGSLAVFVTLGYLSLQVRHAREEMRLSLTHNRLEAIRGIMVNRMNNKHLTAVAMKAVAALGQAPGPFQTTLMDRAGLAAEDAVALQLDMGALWQCHAEAFPYADQMRDGERTAFNMQVRDTYRSALGALWYQTNRPRLDPEAVRYVDNLLAKPD